MNNIVRIPVGDGDEPARDVPSSAATRPDLATQAARAALGIVVVAVEAVIGILRRVSGYPDHEEEVAEPEGVALITGAALGLAIEAIKVGAAAAELARRTVVPPTAFLVDTFFDGARRTGEDLAGQWNDEWRAERPGAATVADAVVVETVRRAIEAILGQLDLTEIVLDLDLDRIIAAVDLDAVVRELDVNAIVRRVDINGIIGQVDIDAVASRIDVEQIAERIDLDTLAGRIDMERLIARLDLAKLSLEVIDQIDLPEIIRSSTGAVASESVRIVRMQTFGADRAITGLVGRVLGRRPPEPDGSADPSATDDPDG
jgi:hypothetical protein